MTSRVAVVALCLILVMALGACQTSQPGVQNRAGAVQTTLEGTPEQVTTAARRALEDMRLIIVEDQATQVDGRITARTARDDRVRIDVDRVDDASSRISIRVGTFGDESMSLTILDRVRRHLN